MSDLNRNTPAPLPETHEQASPKIKGRPGPAGTKTDRREAAGSRGSPAQTVQKKNGTDSSHRGSAAFARTSGRKKNQTRIGGKTIALGAAAVILLCVIIGIFSGKGSSKSGSASAGGAGSAQTAGPSSAVEIGGNGEETPPSVGTEPAETEPDAPARLTVPAIENGSYSAEDLELRTVRVPRADILRWSGVFSSDKQEDEYSFTAERSGSYSFFFTDILEGQKYPIQVLNAAGEAVNNRYWSYTYGLGDCVDLTLSRGQRYTVRVRQESNYYGSYCLNIGLQKEYTEITGCAAVYDAVEFIQQQNGYLFTPSVTGEYRFGFSGIPEGYKYCIQVVNAGGDAISNQYWSYSYGNKDGTTVSLNAGQTYTVIVKQNDRYYGEYCLDVGLFKETGDISPFYAVSDSIQVIGQRNLYSFTPEFSGTYEFGISDVPDGIKYLIQVVNAGGDAISNPYWSHSYGNGDRISAELTAGQTYTVAVRPDSEYYGRFTLNIGKYRAPVDISGWDSVSDQMQYRLQRNLYTFTPNSTGTYEFTLSDMPAGYEYPIQVRNAGGEAVSNHYWNYTYGNGQGPSVELTAGQTYTVEICQTSDALGEYTLTVSAG